MILFSLMRSAMNAIQKALQEIRFKIPQEILAAAFIDDQPFRTPTSTNLDYAIREKVIVDRVLVDINLQGGQLHMVDMTGVIPEYSDQFSAVFRVPKELTGGRTISRVLAMAYGDQRAYGNYLQSTTAYNTTADAMNGVLSSHLGIAMTETTNVQLIGENTVLITDMTAVPTRTHLRCYLDHDPELSQMRPPLIPVFAELVTYAVKSYIYNTLMMKIGRDVMIGGRDLGEFKRQVEAMADAEELYTTMVNGRWVKSVRLNDELSRRRITRMGTTSWG